MNIEINVVPVEEIYPLRHKVLRAGQPIETCYYPEDLREGVFHLAAIKDGSVVGIASFYPENHDSLSPNHCWRLRGMATSESIRGQGVGRQLLQHGLQHCQQLGADLLWCNARVSASEFYRKLNFAIQGEAFNIEDIGPHYLMYYQY